MSAPTDASLATVDRGAAVGIASQHEVDAGVEAVSGRLLKAGWVGAQAARSC